jgi:hypothetical protein
MMHFTKQRIYTGQVIVDPKVADRNYGVQTRLVEGNLAQILSLNRPPTIRTSGEKLKAA